mmetsp:Transcript_5421/g.10328  ORF Transcript_5421/g.10328 Transcript_5421/m.10328 type:complete len:259 (-) Transcript_5421:60-836(-)
MNKQIVLYQTQLFHKAITPIIHRTFASGTRGARGHGWFQKYRAGLSGRHLQGRFHNRDVQKRIAINQQVFGLNDNQQYNPKGLNHLAYLDLQVADDQKDHVVHRIVIELATAALPSTCENFIKLCQEGLYKNSKIFKIEPKVGLCLGDVTEKNDGMQGQCHESLGNDAAGSPATFAHERMVLSHVEKGIVSMLSTGLDQNDSRFMITTVDDAPHLDGRYVAFGKVREGLNVLEDIVKNTYTKRGRPTVAIQVVESGTL